MKELSIAEKLSQTAGNHLINYIKLLAGLKEAQQAIDAEKAAKDQVSAKAITDEQIKEALSSAPIKPL